MLATWAIYDFSFGINYKQSNWYEHTGLVMSYFKDNCHLYWCISISVRH